MNKYTTLPSGKAIRNIDQIKFIDSIKEFADEFASPAKHWVEFDILYDNNEKVNLSYDVMSTALVDRDFLLQKIHSLKFHL